MACIVLGQYVCSWLKQTDFAPLYWLPTSPNKYVLGLHVGYLFIFRGVLLWRVIRPLCGIDWERGTRVDRVGAGTACCFPMLGEFNRKKRGGGRKPDSRETGTVNQPRLGFLYRTDSDTCHPPIAPSIWHISKEQIVNHKEMKLITPPSLELETIPNDERNSGTPAALSSSSKPVEVMFKVRTNLPAHRAHWPRH